MRAVQLRLEFCLAVLGRFGAGKAEAFGDAFPGPAAPPGLGDELGFRLVDDAAAGHDFAAPGVEDVIGWFVAGPGREERSGEHVGRRLSGGVLGEPAFEGGIVGHVRVPG